MDTLIIQWQRKHGVTTEAMIELSNIMGAVSIPTTPESATKPEQVTQQNIRLSAGHHGVKLWRNNVGATPAKIQYTCNHCGNAGVQINRPVRYGLANDSVKMNQVVKSSDLIGITPVEVTPDHVGSLLGVFTAIECKHSQWVYNDYKHEAAQYEFMKAVISSGGIAQFARSPDDIWGRNKGMSS